MELIRYILTAYLIIANIHAIVYLVLYHRKKLAPHPMWHSFIAVFLWPAWLYRASRRKK